MQDTFPSLDCYVQPNVTVIYRGNHYNQMYKYASKSDSQAYQKCLEFVNEVSLYSYQSLASRYALRSD